MPPSCSIKHAEGRRFQFRVTVDEIEKRTGLIIRAGLPDDVLR